MPHPALRRLPSAANRGGASSRTAKPPQSGSPPTRFDTKNLDFDADFALDNTRSHETLFLSTREIAELTGAHLKSRQIKALKEMNIPHRVNVANEPVVLRASIYNVFGLGSRHQPEATWEPALQRSHFTAPKRYGS